MNKESIEHIKNENNRLKEEVARLEGLLLEGKGDNSGGFIDHQLLLDSVEGIVYVHDLEGKILYVSSAIEHKFGYNPDEFINQDLYKFIYPDDRIVIEKHIGELFRQEHGVSLELRVIDSTGKIFWVLSHFKLIKIAAKVLVQGVLLDISKQKEVEQRLENQEKYLRNIIENTNEVIYTLSEDYKITFCSGAWSDIFGEKASKVIGESIFKKIHDEDKELVKQFFQEIKQSSANKQGLEHRMYTGKGEVVWVSLNGNVLDSAINKSSYFVGTIRDINLRKKAEQALIDSEKNYRDFFNTLEDFFFVLDLNGIIVHVNKTVKERLGYREKELINRSALSLHPKLFYAQAAKDIRALLKGKKKFYRVPFETVSGDIIPVESHIKKGKWNGEEVFFGISKDISELTYTEEKFTKAFHYTGTSKLVLELNTGFYLESNLAFRKLLEYDKKELEASGVDCYSLLFNKDFKSYLIKSLTKEAGLKPFESGFNSKTGKKIYGIFVIERLNIGQEKYVLIDITDITKRKEDEQVLKENLRYFEAINKINHRLLNEHDDLFGDIIMDIREIYSAQRAYLANPINQKTDKFYIRYQSCEAEYEVNWDLPHEMPITDMEKRLMKKLVSDKGKSVSISFENTYLEDEFGVKRQLLVSIFPKHGEPWVLGLHRGGRFDDWTDAEKHLFEDIAYRISDSLGNILLTKKIKKSQRELKQMERQFTSFFNHSSLGLAILNSDLEYLAINTVLAKMNGIAAEDHLNRHVEKLLPPQIAKLHVEKLMKLKEQKESVHIENGFLSKFDNQHKYFLTTYFPIEDDTGKILSIGVVVFDQTVQKLAEEALLKAKNKAEEADKLKSAFLANMSHEIRTPMNGILGFVQLLDDDSLSQIEREEYLKIINKSGRQLITVIDDIIDISKIEAGEVKIKKASVSICTVISEIIALYEKQKEDSQKQIELSSKISPEIKDCMLYTDEMRLRQILINLFGNAFKFTEKGYVKLFVEKENNFVKFTVSDTGIGISPEMQSKIFDRFVQVDDSQTRKYGGTGLGLTITKGLVKLLGGEISLSSVPNKGTDFTFTLPYIEVQNTNKSAFSSNYETSIKYDFTGKTILLVEDNPISRRFIEVILKRANPNLIFAETGQEAVDICMENLSVDLVLMDIQLPVLNGYKATEIIKKSRPNLPIIAQTANAMDDDRDKALNAGCNDYITKPLNADELFALITKYV